MLNKSEIAHKEVQRRGILCLCILLVGIALASCHRGGNSDVHFLRFEQFLLDENYANANATQFDSPLLNYYPEDTQFMQMLQDFRNDEVVRYIYHITDSLYGDFSPYEKQLDHALKRAQKLCPSIHYDRFYTLITADFDDYQNRVFCSENELAISIDRYAVGSMHKYQYFGLPSYILALSTKEHIISDCMAAIARAHTVMPDRQPTMLDYAIAEGKAIYFTEKTLPGIADTMLMRYTADQMEWIKHNLSQVWSWLIENKMLYASDYSQLRNYIDDAPKTNAFGEGSAPRTPQYIGWQIVKQYMKKSGSTMEELLEETDSQKILTLSGWRP